MNGQSPTYGSPGHSLYFVVDSVRSDDFVDGLYVLFGKSL